MKPFLILLAVVALPVSGMARTFTNTKGKKLEGELVKVDGANAEIQLKEGKSVKVPVKTLSVEDQKLCTEWVAAHPIIKLNVTAAPVTAPSSRKTTADDTNVVRLKDEGYRISVNNWSKQPGTKLTGLTVDYAIVVGYFDNTKRDQRGVKEIVRGSARVSDLLENKPESVLTKTVTTGSAFNTTRTSNGNGKILVSYSKYRESVDGVCLIIRQGDTVLEAYSTGKVPADLKLEFSK